MMKSRRYNITILSIFLIIVSGCDLDRFPLDRPSSETFISTPDELEAAVVGLYQPFWFDADGANWINIYPLFDVLTDIAWERGDTKFQQIGAGIHDVNNYFASMVWNRSYLAIGRCNYLLDNMYRVQDLVDESTFEAAAAQAKFIRAFWYMILTELYGDVPAIFNTQTLDEANTPKSPKDVIINQILDDLTHAEVLPEIVPESSRGRITKGAVLALKARVALYNRHWEIAANAAKAAIDLNVYQLDDNFENLFTNSGQVANTEIIFDIQYDRVNRYHQGPMQFNTRMTQGYSTKIPTQSLVDSYECIDGKTIFESPLYDPEKPFENRDPRLKHTVVVPGEIFGGYQFETHRDSVKIWNYNTTPATRVDNQDVLNPYASFSGYCWKKYSYMEDGLAWNRSRLNFIFIRYAELLLIHAEAKGELGQIDADAYKSINDVRRRVGMPALQGLSSTEFVQAVRRERKYELALEGHRLFDIRRWKIAESVMPGPLLGRIPDGLLASAPYIDENATPNYESVTNRSSMRIIEQRLFNPNRDYLFPIPRLEVETNTALEQNPNY